MAGWSGLKNGLALDFADVNKTNTDQDSSGCPNTNHAVKGDGDDVVVVDDSGDGCEVKLRCLFYQVLDVLWNESAGKGRIRPVHEMLADGKSVDLFELFWVVKKRGGYHMVNCFWTFVMKELRLDLKFSASVKLVYYKYLYGFEKWLRRKCKYAKMGNGNCQCDFGSFFVELETKFRIWASCGFDRKKKKDNKISFPECEKNDKPSDADVRKRIIGSSDTKDVNGVSSGVRNRSCDDDKIFQPKQKKYINVDDRDVMVLYPNTGNKGFNSHKRKREPLSRMLNWVIQVAKCPLDSSIGKIPPPSKWRSQSGSELWVQAIRARKALLLTRHVDSNGKQSLLQNNVKMHLSMYEDFSLQHHQSAGRSRCSGPSKAFSSPKTECNSGLNKLTHGADKLSTCLSEDKDFQRRVAVGPRFQVEVPEWTTAVSESESKWLGMKVWPWGDGDHNGPINNIGKGRPDSCDCQLPGSVGCIRFHIAEKRMKLKNELGSMFYFWRFDCMGEDVSLRWTAHDEKRFKDMVRLNRPSQGKSFWDIAHKYFPRKTREDLVSYYFNVFLFRRRSYQNRVTSDHIDSDDDELEFGSYGYGHEAVWDHPGANMLICSQNKQCNDIPEN